MHNRGKEIDIELLEQLCDVLADTLGDKGKFEKKPEVKSVEVIGETPEDLEDGLDLAADLTGDEEFLDEVEELPQEELDVLGEEELLEEEDDDEAANAALERMMRRGR